VQPKWAQQHLVQPPILLQQPFHSLALLLLLHLHVLRVLERFEAWRVRLMAAHSQSAVSNYLTGNTLWKHFESFPSNTSKSRPINSMPIKYLSDQKPYQKYSQSSDVTAETAVQTKLKLANISYHTGTLGTLTAHAFPASTLKILRENRNIN